MAGYFNDDPYADENTRLVRLGLAVSSDQDRQIMAREAELRKERDRQESVRPVRPDRGHVGRERFGGHQRRAFVDDRLQRPRQDRQAGRPRRFRDDILP